MNKYLKAYRVLTGLGIGQNLVFAASAFFFPALLATLLAGGDLTLFSGPWLFNTGLLLLLCAVLYGPTVKDPAGHPTYTRLVPWTRLLAAAFWVVHLLTAGSDLPGGFWIIPTSDGALGAVTLWLARRGLAGRSELV